MYKSLQGTIMRMLILLMLFFFCPLIFPAASFASSAKVVQEGNRLYQQEKYDEAINKYNQAKTESPDSDSDILNFNLGAALYKKARYAEAIDAFTNALSTDDGKLEAKAVYNMANSKYMLGNSLANTDMKSAAGLYRESLDYYKRAIELDEGNKDAKYNHELVEKKLKMLLDKMKNQEEQKDQGEDKEGKQENEQLEEKSGKEKKGEGEGEGRQQESGNEQPEEKGAGDETEGKEDTGETQSAGAQGQATREMSPEEARMLLNAYGQEEAGSNLKQSEKEYYREVLKDW